MPGVFVNFCFLKVNLDSIPKIEDTRAMRYTGGKNVVYHKIINLMPPHGMYIEPFLGSGAIMRYKKPALINIGIDLLPSAITSFEDAGQNEIELINGCGISFLKSISYFGDELIYLDPPYLEETWRSNQRKYKFGLTRESHKELLSLIQTLPCKVMISGYYSTLYSEALKNWNVITFPSMTRGGKAIEYLWFNYPEPVALHDYRYLGKNFKNREHIKNKRKRLINKVLQLKPIERNAFLEDLGIALGPILESEDILSLKVKVLKYP